MTNKTGTSRIATINTKLIGAMVSGGLAWGFWRLGTGEWALLRLYAAAFAVGAVAAGLHGLWMLGKALGSLTRLSRFKGKGAAPKADSLAQSADLKKRGLIK